MKLQSGAILNISELQYLTSSILIIISNSIQQNYNKDITNLSKRDWSCNIPT